MLPSMPGVCYVMASLIALATFVTFWLFHVMVNDSQIVRAASSRARGSVQSAVS